MAHRGPTINLADTSALEQRKHSRQAAVVIKDLQESGALATCEMLSLEQLYSARNAADRDAKWAALVCYRWLNVTTGVMRRALEVQRLLTDRGQHRLAIADLIIAATAELNGAVVLHYDKDYDTIAAVTGQPTRWIVPRGTGL